MALADPHGLPRTLLMKFTLKLLANLATRAVATRWTASSTA
jgi:hypothetical protein